MDLVPDKYVVRLCAELKLESKHCIEKLPTNLDLLLAPDVRVTRRSRGGRRSLAISSKPFSCHTQLGLTHIRHAASVTFHIVAEGKTKFWGLSEEENPFPASKTRVCSLDKIFRDGSKIKDTETFCKGEGRVCGSYPEIGHNRTRKKGSYFFSFFVKYNSNFP